MRTIEQLRNDFALYFEEIERCQNTKCYWALLHILLALPDICASLQTDPTCSKANVGNRYVAWCNAYLPSSATFSASDRYQMRNALLHAGSTTPENRGKKRETIYRHFSYVAPESFDVSVHDTTNLSGRVLNVHIEVIATETMQAIHNWFKALQHDSVKMSYVEQNIGRLARIQPKKILIIRADGSQVEKSGWTRSST